MFMRPPSWFLFFSHPTAWAGLRRDCGHTRWKRELFQNRSDRLARGFQASRATKGRTEDRRGPVSARARAGAKAHGLRVLGRSSGVRCPEAEKTPGSHPPVEPRLDPE